MAKKQTRRSISVSGDTYNAVRDFCDEHGLSASGLVTDLLNQYLEDNADGPPPSSTSEKDSTADEESQREPEETEDNEEEEEERSTSPVHISPPQAARDARYPDRRGPGFSALPEGATLTSWLVTAQLEITRKRQLDAETSVETLLMNLVHRRMVNSAQILDVEEVTDED